MKLKKLTLLVHEGLANRIRTIASFYPLIDYNVQINIIWIKNCELNCSFDKLFYPIKNINIVDVDAMPKLYNSFQKNIIKRIFVKILIKFMDIIM